MRKWSRSLGSATSADVDSAGPQAGAHQAQSTLVSVRCRQDTCCIEGQGSSHYAPCSRNVTVAPIRSVLREGSVLPNNYNVLEKPPLTKTEVQGCIESPLFAMAFYLFGPLTHVHKQPLFLGILTGPSAETQSPNPHTLRRESMFCEIV